MRPLTRRQALAAGAAGVATPLLLAGPAAFAQNDPDEQQHRYEEALVAALGLEQIAIVSYEAIANSGDLSERATALFHDLLKDDQEHAKQLEAAIDEIDAQPPIPPRRAAIPGLALVRTDPAAARFAIDIEERTIAAYIDAVRDFVHTAALRAIAGAMGTDGQHLVVLRELAGTSPVPGAFEQGRPG